MSSSTGTIPSQSTSPIKLYTYGIPISRSISNLPTKFFPSDPETKSIGKRISACAVFPFFVISLLFEATVISPIKVTLGNISIFIINKLSKNEDTTNVPPTPPIAPPPATPIAPPPPAPTAPTPTPSFYEKAITKSKSFIKTKKGKAITCVAVTAITIFGLKMGIIPNPISYAKKESLCTLKYLIQPSIIPNFSAYPECGLASKIISTTAGTAAKISILSGAIYTLLKW